MENPDIVSSEWEHVLSLLPEDWEESCQAKLAMVRRRQIVSAEDLLRVCLAYSVCDLSLRQLAAWASNVGLGEVSDVALLKRLRRAGDWLGHLIVRWLQERGLTQQVAGRQVRVVDATCLQRPGRQGIDYRVHLGFDLSGQRITEVEVTDKSGGETLKRHRVQAGEIFLGDRGYAHRQGMAAVLRRGGHVVVRGHWHNLPLQTERGKPVDVVALLETVQVGEIGDWKVYLENEGERFVVRLIAIKKSGAAAERERLEMQKQARQEGRRADARGLRAAQYIYVVTDLEKSELTATEALELYRFRWQIELAFKRLKGLHHLDHLRAREAALTRTYIFGKILGALIVEDLCETALAFFPWGFRLPATAA